MLPRTAVLPSHQEFSYYLIPSVDKRKEATVLMAGREMVAEVPWALSTWE